MNKESESGIYLVVFACVKQTVSSRSEFMCQQPVTMFYSFKSLLFFCSERAEAISVTNLEQSFDSKRESQAYD